MKKIILMVCVASIALFTSCSKKHAAADIELLSQQDSLNYAYGAALGQQLLYSLNRDSLYQADPQKVVDAIDNALENGKETNEYRSIGLNLGRSLQQLRKEGIMNGAIECNEKAIVAGVVNQLLDDNEVFTSEEADVYLNLKMREIREKQMKATIQQLPPEIPDSLEGQEETELEELQIAE